MGGGGKKQKAKSILQIISAAVPFLSDLWDAIGVLWNRVFTWMQPVLKWVDAVSPVVEWVQKTLGPLVDWINENVWPLVKSTYEFAHNLYEHFSNLVDEIYKTIKKVEDSTFGKIEEIRQWFRGVTDDLSRVTRIISPDLAEHIIKIRDDILEATVEKILVFRREIFGVIDQYRSVIIKEVNDRFFALKNVYDTLRDAHDKLESFVAPAFEEVNVLSRKTIERTTRKYGEVLYRELFAGRIIEVTIPEIRQTEEVKVTDHIDESVLAMDQGEFGPWADVNEILVEAVAALDEGQDPPEFDIEDFAIPDPEGQLVKDVQDFLETERTE